MWGGRWSDQQPWVVILSDWVTPRAHYRVAL